MTRRAKYHSKAQHDQMVRTLEHVGDSRIDAINVVDSSQFARDRSSRSVFVMTLLCTAADGHSSSSCLGGERTFGVGRVVRTW